MEKSKPWQKAWCVIPKQEAVVLYMYGAPQVSQEEIEKLLVITDIDIWGREIRYLGNGGKMQVFLSAGVVNETQQAGKLIGCF